MFHSRVAACERPEPRFSSDALLCAGCFCAKSQSCKSFSQHFFVSAGHNPGAAQQGAAWCTSRAASTLQTGTKLTTYQHVYTQVTTHNLERVRRIKSRMVRLKTRGETIKEVLEKYLDDDSDMKDMNLTAK